MNVTKEATNREMDTLAAEYRTAMRAREDAISSPVRNNMVVFDLVARCEDIQQRYMDAKARYHTAD